VPDQCGGWSRPVALGRFNTKEKALHNEFTAIIERDGDWFIAYCPEIPGANGQGRTKEEAKKSLAEAIELILEDRREEGIRGVPEDAVKEVVSLG
jgi:predicted RNase H-like HicB family nuclease